MLTLDSVAESQGFLKVVTEYKPLTITFQVPGLGRDDFYYWRATNSRSLLEIKLGASNGMLLEIDVVLASKDLILEKSTIRTFFDSEKVKNGSPSFQRDFWINRIGPKEIFDENLRVYDEDIPFIFNVAHDGVSVIFDGIVPTTSIKNRDLDFLFSEDGRLSGFVLNDGAIGKKAAKLWLGNEWAGNE